MSNKEQTFLLRKSQLDQIVQYLMQVPTGNVPGARLVQVMTTLDQLQEVPPQILEVLQSAARGAVPVPVNLVTRPTPTRHNDEPVDRDYNGASDNQD